MGMTAAFNTEGKRTAPLRPSNLQFDKVILHSSTGVQQGDPLGPLLFAAGVQLLVAGLRASPVDFTSFYLDDGVLAGSVDSVATALAQLQQASATIGLSLNLTKSEAIAVGATPGAALTAKLPPNLLTTPDGEIRTLRNFECLGAGIGDPAYLQAHAAARVEATRMLLDAIGRLEDPQVALRLLRASAGFGRLMHTMRCCPPAGHAAALDTFDHLVQECFSSFTGLHLEPAQWQQATRGLGHAGLGLRLTREHAPAAYLASVGACVLQCSELDGGPWLDQSADVAAALSDFNANVPPDKQFAVPATEGAQPRSGRGGLHQPVGTCLCRRQGHPAL